jgi:hypothetical protein
MESINGCEWNCEISEGGWFGFVPSNRRFCFFAISIVRSGSHDRNSPSLFNRTLVMICHILKEMIHTKSSFPKSLDLSVSLATFMENMMIFFALFKNVDEISFIGDHVDWGTQSIQTITHLLGYKILFPNTYFLCVVITNALIYIWMNSMDLKGMHFAIFSRL